MADSVNSSVAHSRRARRVVETEERILSAARELFIERGYLRTTLADVAKAADLAPRTVYVRFETKAKLLNRVIDVAIVGDTNAVPLAERDWMRRSLTAPTLDERIAAFAAGAAALMKRAAPVIAVAVEAERSEPEIAAAGAAGRTGTHYAIKTFWQHAAADGLLPRDSNLTWLVQTTALLAQAETYLLGQRVHRWTNQTYRRWLATTLHQLAAITDPTNRRRGQV